MVLPNQLTVQGTYVLLLFLQNEKRNFKRIYQRSLCKISEDGRDGMEGVELTLKIRHGSCNSDKSTGNL